MEKKELFKNKKHKKNCTKWNIMKGKKSDIT